MLHERKFLLKGKAYFLRECTYEDIPSHLEKVSSYWEQHGIEFPDSIREACKESVKKKYAFKLISEDDELVAFLYLKRVKVSEFFCLSIYFIRKVFISIIFHHLKRINIRYLMFTPINTESDEIPFRNMLSKEAIRDYKQNRQFIRIDMYSEHGSQFYKYQYERLGVKEVHPIYG